jgi:predicted dehydrogenase
MAAAGGGAGAGPDRELRAGLIGYGLAGAAFHAPLVAATPGLRLAAVVTSDPGRVEAARRAFPEAAVVGSVEELWGLAGGLDLAVVAAPNRFHVPLAEAALAAGLAVVVDKPLAPSAAEGRRLVASARRRGRLLTVFHNRRWDGDFLTLRRLVEGGALGRVLRFESRFERWRPQPPEGWRQRGDPAEAGGLLFDLGSHLVDQAMVLFGPVRRVYAELAAVYEGAAVDNDGFVALEHVSGVRSHLWASALAGLPGPRFRVLGTRAAWEKHGLDGQEAALRGGKPPGGAGWGEEPQERWGRLGAGERVEKVPTEPGAWPWFYRSLVAALREGAPPPVDPEDAVAGLEVLEAARRSAAEGRVVAVAPGGEAGVEGGDGSSRQGTDGEVPAGGGSTQK